MLTSKKTQRATINLPSDYKPAVPIQPIRKAAPSVGQMGLLEWVKNRTMKYQLEVKNYLSSWQDGLVYCALLHSYRPDLIGDFDALRGRDAKENLKLAYKVAHQDLEIPELLDFEDFGLEKLSMMTQLSEVYKVLELPNK